MRVPQESTKRQQRAAATAEQLQAAAREVFESRGYAATLRQGCGIVFTTRERPVRSARGWSAAPMRHGVSTVRTGVRHTLGLVFHDAA